MAKFDSILVAAEHGSVGREAVCRAAALAKRHDARLQLVALSPRARRPWRRWFAAPLAPAQPHAAHGHALQQLAAQIAGRERVAALADAVGGGSHESLLRAATLADLVVIGHGGGALLDALCGARVVRALARECPRPLLVVRKPGDASYRQVLVPMALQACEQAAVRVAARVAGEGGLHLFHAIDPMAFAWPWRAHSGEAALREARARARAAAHARLRRAVWRSGLERGAVNYTVAHGPPLGSAKRHARRIAADLVVHQRGHGERGALLADTAARARWVAGSGCDLLIVPPPGTADSTHARAGMATMNSWLHGAAALAPRRSI